MCGGACSGDGCGKDGYGRRWRGILGGRRVRKNTEKRDLCLF